MSVAEVVGLPARPERDAVGAAGADRHPGRCGSCGAGVLLTGEQVRDVGRRPTVVVRCPDCADLRRDLPNGRDPEAALDAAFSFSSPSARDAALAGMRYVPLPSPGRWDMAVGPQDAPYTVVNLSDGRGTVLQVNDTLQLTVQVVAS